MQAFGVDDKDAIDNLKKVLERMHSTSTVNISPKGNYWYFYRNDIPQYPIIIIRVREGLYKAYVEDSYDCASNCSLI